MSTSAVNVTTFFNNLSIRILNLLRYTVPSKQRHQGFVKASFSYILPTITAILSFCMLEIAMFVFFANIIGLLYKFFTAVFSYQSFKRSFESGSSVAISLYETPLLIRAVVLFVLVVILLLIIVFAIAIPESVTFDSAWAICAGVNIVVTWAFDVIDSLVAVYGAEIVSHNHN